MNRPMRTAIIALLLAGTATATAQAATIVGWGANSLGESHSPAGDSYVAVSAGNGHSLALKSDSRLYGWGGFIGTPSGRFYTAISAGGGHGLGLRSPGTSISTWGSNRHGQLNIPIFVAAAIAGGMRHSVAIDLDGGVVSWGYGADRWPAPEGNDFVAIDAGNDFSLALRADGSLVGWGDNGLGQIDVPPGNDFTAVTAGGRTGYALREDGSLVAWGLDLYGQIRDLPAGNDFIAVDGGDNHAVALRRDGTLVAWGSNFYGQTDVPAGNRYIAISAGGRHSLALQIPEPSSLILLLSLAATCPFLLRRKTPN